jgi:hypothetical protein
MCTITVCNNTIDKFILCDNAFTEFPPDAPIIIVNKDNFIEMWIPGTFRIKNNRLEGDIKCVL